MKILIAEDDLTSRLMLQGILQKWGYAILTACDGLEAWEMIQSTGRPQIVLLDWEMPEMNGIEVCRKAKQLDLPIPVYLILLTGRDSKADIVEGLEAGADDYITKPFDNNELRARLRVAERMVDVQQILADKVDELEEALEHVKVLQGIIPICMYCHKIRNDNQAWDKLESYICEHSDAQFSHSICPECFSRYYPEED